ncbi:MAG: uncharacterized protein JWO12_1241 [Frankiales bacterium]|nr:uncharacterized protein [Frankiales bacterium]
MTPSVTAAECVAKIKGPVSKLGGAWMFDAKVNARGAELGLDTWAWYHCGRGGVLGNPDPSVVVAAFGFFPPELQTKAWLKGVAVMDPAQTAEEYAKACAEWGFETFATVAEAGRLADLLTTALDTASLMGLPLFAGWLAKLHDVAGASGPVRLALALQAAREHRGSCHLAAVAAAGVPPLQAVMSGRYGSTNAEFFGWPKPWPSEDLAKDAMAAAEVVTDAMVAPAFEVLSAQERAELTAGLRAL